MISCGMVLSFRLTFVIWLLATSLPFRMASATSPALPSPTPTRPCLPPTTTRALKLKRLPPLTTLEERLMKTTFSDNSADGLPSVRISVSPVGLPLRPPRQGPRPPGPGRPPASGLFTNSATIILLVQLYILKFQSCFPRRISQSLDLAVITSPISVENNLLDPFAFGGLCGQRPQAFRRLDIGARFLFFGSGFRAGRCRRERDASRIVDELDVNILVGEADAHTRAHFASAHFLANSPAPQLSELMFLLLLHVFSATDFAVTLNKNRRGYWTVLPSLRTTCSSL